MEKKNIDPSRTKEVEKSIPEQKQLKDCPFEICYQSQLSQVELEMQIEALHRHQEELKTAHDQYLNLFESAPVGLLTCDEFGVVLEINHSLIKLLGYSKSEVVGRAFGQFFPDYMSDHWFRHVKMVVGTGLPQLCELSLVTAEGLTINVLLQSTLTRADESIEVRSACIDQTQYHQSITDKYKIRQKNKELQDVIDSMRMEVLERRKTEEINDQLTKQLLQIQEAERQKIARDLHDQLAQDLAGVKLFVDQLSQDEGIAQISRGHLVQCGGAISNCIDFIRRLAYESLLPDLESLPFSKHIQQLYQEIFSEKRIECRMELELFNQLELDWDTKYNLYRIIQESLRNIMKHAQAEQIRLEARGEGGDLILEISDDGIGLGDQVGAKGEGEKLGLQVMRNRAKSIGADLKFTPLGDKGTLTRLIMPDLKSLEPKG